MVRLFKINLRIGILAVFIAVTAFWPVVSAATVDVNTFSVKAIIPENQVDKRQTFFDLRLSPGEEQIIQMIITNSEDYPINAYIDINTASTGINGIILYNQENVCDSSQICSVAEIATVMEPYIIIPANSSATVDIHLQMPDFIFDGHLLGGIVVSADVDEDIADVESGDGIQIKNKFLYIIGLKLSNTDTPVEPELSLISIAPGLDNYRGALNINVQNSQPVIIKGMDVHAQVYRGNSAEVYRELILNDVEMAPNSTGVFVVNWDNKAFEKGRYRLKMQIRHNDRLWEWEEYFTVDSGTAKQLQENSIIESKPAYTGYVLLAMFILIMILGFVFWLGRRSTANRT